MSAQQPTAIAPSLQRPVRTPCVLQMEMVECGAAALGIVLAYHGRYVALSALRRECGVSRDGSKASNIIKAARRYGFVAKGFKKSVEGCLALKPPTIVFWQFNHFIVVEGATKDWVYVNDPAMGRRKLTHEEFDKGFTGVVLVFEPTDAFEPGGNRPSMVGALRDRLRGAGQGVAYCLAVGLLLALPAIAVPALIQLLIDQVLIGGNKQWLRPLIAVFVGISVLQVVLTLLQLRQFRRLEVRLAVGMSTRFLWHLLQLPMSFYGQRFTGEIATRLHLNNSIADLLSGRLGRTAVDVVMLVLFGIVMLYYDPLLTAIGVGLTLVNFVVLTVVARRRVEAQMRLSIGFGKTAAVGISGLQNIETIKASGLEDSFFSRWAGHYTKSVNASQELQEMNQGLGVLPVLLGSLTTVVVLAVGGLRVVSGALTIGMLIAFWQLMQSFQRPVATLVGMESALQTLKGDMARIDDVLRHPPDALQSHDEVAGTGLGKLQGHVELVNLTFGYSPIEPPLIDGLSLKLKPGHRIALVGGSGSGKSTVAKLVCGLYKPWSGDVLFDGKRREDVAQRVMLRSLAMVDQDLFLFSGSVRDNVSLWDPTMPQSDLEAACRDAAILDDFLKLPGGFDAPLLEGAMNLSGGQRQRLEIARALVQNPTVLILDEATSALDAETEHRIDQAIRRRGCAALIVAHRLSTIRDSDEIIVLERGKVVERGSHDELWALGGHYRNLIQSEA